MALSADAGNVACARSAPASATSPRSAWSSNGSPRCHGPGSAKTYRLVIRRQLIDHYEGQRHLFDEYRYRYIVTNLPESISTVHVVDLTYERCKPGNIIQQLGAGIAAWRMPVAEFDGNSAWLEIAWLAWSTSGQRGRIRP